MRLPHFEYEKASSLEQCLDILEQYGEEVMILAGGTDLLVNMKYGTVRPNRILSIKSIADLQSIDEDGEGNVKIGAGATLSDIARNPIVSEKLPALHEAVRSIASKHIRNMACIGGNICLPPRCWYFNQSRLWREALGPCHRTQGTVCHAMPGAKRCHAVNYSDTAPVLMALNAQVHVMNKKRERVMPLREFYRDNGAAHTVLAPDEILTSVLVPQSALSRRTVFIKVSDRKGLDFATGNISVSIKNKGQQITEVAIVVNSVTSAPVRLNKAADHLMTFGFEGTSVSGAGKIARSELGPVTNLFTSAGTKRRIVEVLVKRAVDCLKANERKAGN
ncbi:MAG: xanthine dehydrogenase family protein subunit M [Desulfobacterales bacterium]|jgi:4-hydroxybenzoyl-CoA reductase beta subunit|nr:xanthine dehydrogenase family protein subunit M [Desulfobacterales bacterium]